MGVRSRRSKSKRRRRRDIGGGGGGVDLISGLSDDLLVRILELLPDPRDVVRTDVLSRRWRGLWTGVTALSFNSDNWPAVHAEAGAAERYLAFVNDALTLRAKATTTTRCYSVMDLEISFDISDHETEELVPPSFKAAEGWIRYAVQHEVKSLVLDVRLPWCYLDRLPNEDDVNPETMAIDGLASSAKLETMHLSLSGAKLRLPPSSTVVFSSLTDVSLEDTMVAGHLLSRLVSPPCCPRLRKLRLTDIRFSSMEELLLVEGDTLLELSLDNIENVQSLELRTPSLRVLHVEPCLDLERFTVVSAPRLEDLMFMAEDPLRIVDVHDHLSSVGTLKIQLHSHRDYGGEDKNDTSVHLLQCCRSTKYLKVSLEVVKTKHRIGNIMKGRIPLLTHVTSLKIHATLWEPHSFRASIASFLAQCNNLRYLSLKFSYYMGVKNDDDYTIKHDLLCDDSCQWRSDELSLAHLQEVEFKKLVGTNCEFRFIQSVLARETGIQKVTISLDPYWWLKDNEDALKLVTPLLDGGLWTTCSDTKLLYKWTRCL